MLYRRIEFSVVSSAPWRRCDTSVRAKDQRSYRPTEERRGAGPFARKSLEEHVIQIPQSDI